MLGLCEEMWQFNSRQPRDHYIFVLAWSLTNEQRGYWPTVIVRY